MRHGFVGSLAGLLVSGSLVMAQAPGGSVLPPVPSGTPAVDGDHGHAGTWDTSSRPPEDGIRVLAEYLYWTTRSRVPPDVRNVLSGGSTDAGQVLNNVAINDTWHSGFRAFASYTPADSDWPTVEVGGFFFEKAKGSLDTTIAIHPALSPSGVPPRIFLQPVVGGVIDVAHSRGIADVPNPGPDGVVDLDDSDTLTTHLQATSQRQLWGLEANLHSRPCFYGGLRLDALAGFRYLDLSERFTMQGDYKFAEPPAGGDPDEGPDNPEDNHTNVMHTLDSVDVHNRFYGGQIGFTYEVFVCDCVFIGGFFKLAMGGNRETVTLNGSTILDATTIETHAGGPFVPRPTEVLPGGLFTPAVAGGTVTHSWHFVCFPELNVNLGFAITPNVLAHIGYNYLYLSNVARVGTQSAVTPITTLGHMNLNGVDVGVQIRF